MKFKLTTSKTSYTDEKEIKELESLGFEFEEIKLLGVTEKAILRNVEIEIKNLDELIAFSKRVGDIIIFGKEKEIEIYDDCRE